MQAVIATVAIELQQQPFMYWQRKATTANPVGNVLHEAAMT
jgi:hypothetical protein